MNDKIEMLKNDAQVDSIYLCKYVFLNNSIKYFFDIKYIDGIKKQKETTEEFYNSFDLIERYAEMVSGAKCICTKQIK